MDKSKFPDNFDLFTTIGTVRHPPQSRTSVLVYGLNRDINDGIKLIESLDSNDMVAKIFNDNGALIWEVTYSDKVIDWAVETLIHLSVVLVRSQKYIDTAFPVREQVLMDIVDFLSLVAFRRKFSVEIHICKQRKNDVRE